MQFPKIKDDKKFELLARDIMEKRLGTIFTMYGRKGQSQDGIDIYSSGQNTIGIQCKDILSKKSTKMIRNIIERELKKLEGLEFTIVDFWFVTALNRDVNIQTDNELMNQTNTIKTNVYIMFWEDIEEILTNNIELVKKYYSFFNIQPSKNLSELMNIGFWSEVFASYVELQRLERFPALLYCDIIENTLNWITNNNTVNIVKSNLWSIREYLNGDINYLVNFKKENEYNWCKNIEICLASVFTTLDDKYKKYFLIGKYLGYFDRLLNFSGANDKEVPKNKVVEFIQLLHDLNLSEQDETYVKNQILTLSEEGQEFREILRNIQIPCSILSYLQYKV